MVKKDLAGKCNYWMMIHFKTPEGIDLIESARDNGHYNYRKARRCMKCRGTREYARETRCRHFAVYRGGLESLK